MPADLLDCFAISAILDPGLSCVDDPLMPEECMPELPDGWYWNQDGAAHGPFATEADARAFPAFLD